MTHTEEIFHTSVNEEILRTCRTTPILTQEKRETMLLDGKGCLSLAIGFGFK